MKNLIKTLFFLNLSIFPISSLFSKELRNSDLSIFLEKNLNHSIRLAGLDSDMSKRSMHLFALYLKSNKQLEFSYLISHLTLAIQRSYSSKRMLTLLDTFPFVDYKKAWREWGESLSLINKKMFIRFNFSYNLTEFLVKHNFNISKFPSGNWNEVLEDSLELLPIMIEIHEAKNKGLKLSDFIKKNHTKRLIKWEHEKIIQEMLEESFEKLPLVFKASLRNTPGGPLEKLVNLVSKAQISFSLGCIGNQKLRTKDFMSSDQRVEQAYRFYNLLKDIDFDPSYNCFRGEYKENEYKGEKYYGLNFPREFLKDPEHFVLNFYDFYSDYFYKNNAWVFDQYKFLLFEEYAVVPEFHLNESDKKYLSFNFNSLDRNTYINRQYLKISKELALCTETQKIGNWYGFALYASRGIRDVLDGSRYKKMSWFEKNGLKVFTALDWLNISLQKEVVGRTNALVAIEMIPIGRKFINFFCKSNKKNDFQIFKNLFKNQSSDNLLLKAFYQYFRAIKEKDLKLKKELVTYGSTLQVIFEQIRIDNSLKRSFAIDSRVKFIREELKKSGTKIGRLNFYNTKKFADLDKDISTEYIDKDLLEIELEEYQRLLTKYKIPWSLKYQATLKSSATSDWSNLEERLKFLVGLFRTHI